MAGNTANRVQEQAHAAADALRDKTKEIGGNLKEIGNLLREAVEDKLGNLRESASEAGRRGRETALEYRSDVEDYVRNDPKKSLAIAAGVGFLLGIFMCRK